MLSLQPAQLLHAQKPVKQPVLKCTSTKLNFPTVVWHLQEGAPIHNKEISDWYPKLIPVITYHLQAKPLVLAGDAS